MGADPMTTDPPLLSCLLPPCLSSTEDKGAGDSKTRGPAPRRERLFIAGLCLVAAVRIFVFSAAFPFFNNVDEQFHFDVVFKYSHGRLPLAPLEKFDPETAKIIAVNGTTEYLGKLRDHPSPSEVRSIAASWAKRDNRETWAWPTYYLLAGLWCRLGKLLGLAGGHLLYWIRFLNVPIVAAFVWLSYIFSRKLLPDGRQRIAIPLIVAFFPQDIFFSITSDVLSPLVFAAAFFMLLEICLGEKSWSYHLFAGLAIAVTFLTKASNIAIFPLAAGAILIKIKQAVSQKRLKQNLPSLAALAVAATIPVALWLGRNYILFGDLSGAAKSHQALTWTQKPFSEMFNHPIFTPSGMFFFLSELTKKFWRGEFFWRFKPIAYPFMDWFYCVSSAVFLTTSLLGLVLDKTKMDSRYRFALAAALFVVALSVALLAVLSMRYDFGRCFYPSRERPYFTSGRLIAGTILPFLFLYVDGLRRILSKLHCDSCPPRLVRPRLGAESRRAGRESGEAGLLIIVGVIAAAITVCEIILAWPVFASPYNWFHLK
jgi:hypothetical protein